jgi:hypothetical protein
MFFPLEVTSTSAGEEHLALRANRGKMSSSSVQLLGVK